MGKTGRRSKIRPERWNPIGVDSAIHLQNDEGSGPIEAVISELKNSNVEEKLNGLQSLAVFATSKDKIAAICRTEIVRIAAPFLCEQSSPGQPNLPIRQATAGALRNLSVTGGPEVCEFLVEQDVLTPLLALLNEYILDVTWTPIFDKSMRGQLDLRSDIFLHSINLLWNMCESTSVALETFNQTNMLEGLIRCLDFQLFGLEIAISVAQFLLVVSENNPKSWNVLNQHVGELMIILHNEDSTEHGKQYLSTLSAGIISNVPALAAANASIILNALSKVLHVEHQKLLKDMFDSLSIKERNDKVPELEVKAMDTADGMDYLESSKLTSLNQRVLKPVLDETEEAAMRRRRQQELPSDADVIVTSTGYLVDAQRVAAEVITNLCSTEDEEWIDDDDEAEISESESVCDYSTKQIGDSLNNIHESDRLPVEILEAVKSLNLVDKLWQRAQPLDTAIVQPLRYANMALFMKTKNLRISSLLALQNLCNSLTTEDLGGPNAVYNVWVDLGQQVFKGAQDIAILEPSTSLMRSALEHLKTKRELFDQMTQSDLELILNGVRSCSVAEIRANWLRMLGTLGCLLPESLVKVIISFILEACSKEEDVWTISEALDALMDMFADNDWHQIIVELNLIELSKELDKMFKHKLRAQKRELKERYPAVQTVRTNFARFIKYLENETTKITNGSKK